MSETVITSAGAWRSPRPCTAHWVGHSLRARPRLGPLVLRRRFDCGVRPARRMLLNPTSTPVVVDLSFVTPDGMVHPINYQGIVLQSGQLVAENVASEVQEVSTVSTIVTDPYGPGCRVRAAGLRGGGCRLGRARRLVPGVANPPGGLGDTPGAGGGGRPIRDRRLQPRSVDRGGHREVPVAVGTVDSADRQGAAGVDLGGTDQLADPHPRGETYATTIYAIGRAGRRREPHGEHRRPSAVAPGRHGRGRGRAEHRVAPDRVGRATAGQPRLCRERGRPGVPRTAEHSAGPRPTLPSPPCRPESTSGHPHAGRRQRAVVSGSPLGAGADPIIVRATGRWPSARSSARPPVSAWSPCPASRWRGNRRRVTGPTGRGAGSAARGLVHRPGSLPGGEGRRPTVRPRG